MTHWLSKRSGFVFVMTALTLLAGGTAWGQSGGYTRYVFVNNTGVPDDALFVTLGGATVSSNSTYGNGSQLLSSTSYSLAQMYGTVPNAGPGGPTGSVPTLSIYSASGGAMYVTLGQAINGSTPSTSTVYGRLEQTISGNSTSNNLDISYVDGIGLPMGFSVRNRADGTLIPQSGPVHLPLSQVTTTPGTTIFNNLTANLNISPASARIPANYTAVSSSNATVGTITGLSRVVSPQINTDYHSWTTTSNVTYPALIPTLRSQGTNLSIASYTVPSGDTLGSSVFGFSVVTAGPGTNLPQSPFNDNPSNPTQGQNDPNGVFLAGPVGNTQPYNLTATFLADLNPGGANTRISALGITAGTSGVKFSGYGGASGNSTSNMVGNLDIYITDAELSLPASLYGSNPQYVIDWTGRVDTFSGNLTPLAVLTYNTNSIADRIVGDLTAGINLGWANSSLPINAHAISTNTTTNLSGSSLLSGNASTIGSLTTGEYFYLLSLQQDMLQVADWSGEGIQPNNYMFYNTYGSAFQADTGAYTLAFSDRIQNQLNPDIYYNAAGSGIDLQNVYLQVVLSPGDFTFNPIPEPASLTLLGLGGLALFRRRIRRGSQARGFIQVNGQLDG